MGKIKVLELFAGSRSIGKQAEKMGMQVFSVDWENYENIDLQIDIAQMQTFDVPFIPDFIWASPDCTTYSISAISHHRNKQIPTSDYAKKCDDTNKHFISLIKKWQTINPNLIYFIENPRGMLRHMDWMQEFKRHTVWYCKYGDSRAKPTDLFTNSDDWIPLPVCKNYKYDADGNIIDKHCHHESARRGAKTVTQGKKGSYDRSKIPDKLCISVLESINSKK